MSATNCISRQKRAKEKRPKAKREVKKQASRDAIGEDGNWNLKCKECNDEKVAAFAKTFYDHMAPDLAKDVPANIGPMRFIAGTI
jgi:hypothetical protein